MNLPQTPVPHPSIVAARKGLAMRPPAPLSKILDQIKEAQAWKSKHSSGHGLKRKGA